MSLEPISNSAGMRAATTQPFSIRRSGTRAIEGGAPWWHALLQVGGTPAKTTRPNAPERISPRHAAILVTRGADQITEEQQRVFDRIANQCPEVVELRQIALAFRPALIGGDAAKHDCGSRAPGVASTDPSSGSPTG